MFCDLHFCILFSEVRYFRGDLLMLTLKIGIFFNRTAHIMFYENKNSVKWVTAAAPAKSLRSCPILCDPIDGSPPGSSIPGILQARTLEWVAISFSNAWKWKGKVKSFSRVWLWMTPWTAGYQAPLSMGCSRQEYWSGLPLLSPKWVTDFAKI